MSNARLQSGIWGRRWRAPISFGHPLNVNAVKKMEDGDDVIVRCYETNKMATTTTIHLPLWQRTVEAHFAPCEIKTFRMPGDGTRPVAETGMLEWID